jgi:5S rRNA maturation endonuclease (ribonuclease M5)
VERKQKRKSNKITVVEGRNKREKEEIYRATQSPNILLRGKSKEL